MAAVSLREPDINNKYSTIKNNIKYVCNNLSLDDLKKLPATPIDCKGTISIIPYCVTNQNVFFLLALNHLISNKKHNFVIESIGGDLQYDEKPYDTFISKLGNKVPKYATLIIQSLDAHPQYTEILSIKSNPIKKSEEVFYSIIIFHIISVEDAINMLKSFLFVLTSALPVENNTTILKTDTDALPVKDIAIFSEILRMRDTELSLGLQTYKQHIVRFRDIIIENIRHNIIGYYKDRPSLKYVRKEWSSIRQKVESNMIVVPQSLYTYIIGIIVHLLSINQIKTLMKNVNHPSKTNKSNKKNNTSLTNVNHQSKTIKSNKSMEEPILRGLLEQLHKSHIRMMKSASRKK